HWEGGDDGLFRVGGEPHSGGRQDIGRLTGPNVCARGRCLVSCNVGRLPADTTDEQPHNREGSMKLGPIKSIFGKKTVIWGAGLALVLGGSVGMRSLVGSVNHGHAHVKGATIKSETVDPTVSESPDPTDSPEPTESPE